MRDDAAVRMDQMYRLQRHIYDITRRYFLLGRTTLINGLIPPPNSAVLEIGCGTGWNLIQIARRYPNVRLYGFDVSNVMLETARRKIDDAGLLDRISLSLGDATTFVAPSLPAGGSYDRIVASYVLSMIPEWQSVLVRASERLAPGGSLHLVDFGAGAGLPTPLRVGLQAWLTQFDVTPRLDLATEVDRIARQAHLSAFYTEMHRGYAQYAVLTRR
jgi:S-adenosylmethionine-diacylgycerolhomoserine-N-methlytransferase